MMSQDIRARVNRLRFVAVGQQDPLAEPLLAELAVEYASRYGATEDAVSKWLRGYPADEFAPPGGGLLIGLSAASGSRPVTGGAFRRFDDATAELKRIWTDSRYRRRGYARALLVELEAEIVARGYRRVYLTTGDRQPEAEALYLSAGYLRLAEPLPAEGDVYPLAFVKTLVMTEHLHLAVALDGYGLAPAGVAAHAGAGTHHQRPVLVRPGRYRRAGTARLRDLRRCAHRAAAPPLRDRAPLARGPARRGAGRRAGGAGDQSHRSDSRRHGDPHRAVPRLESHCHT